MRPNKLDVMTQGTLILRPDHQVYVVEITCGPPPDVPNSVRFSSGLFYNDTTTYICHEGHKVEDGRSSKTIRCNETAKWSEELSCKGTHFDTIKHHQPLIHLFEIYTLCGCIQIQIYISHQQ